jgi:hypothetical protein
LGQVGSKSSILTCLCLFSVVATEPHSRSLIAGVC